jgi:hypothetical protein
MGLHSFELIRVHASAHMRLYAGVWVPGDKKNAGLAREYT